MYQQSGWTQGYSEYNQSVYCNGSTWWETPAVRSTIIFVIKTHFRLGEEFENGQGDLTVYVCIN